MWVDAHDMEYVRWELITFQSVLLITFSISRMLNQGQLSNGNPIIRTDKKVLLSQAAQVTRCHPDPFAVARALHQILIWHLTDDLSVWLVFSPSFSFSPPSPPPSPPPPGVILLLSAFLHHVRSDYAHPRLHGNPNRPVTSPPYCDVIAASLSAGRNLLNLVPSSVRLCECRFVGWNGGGGGLMISGRG